MEDVLGGRDILEGEMDSEREKAIFMQLKSFDTDREPDSVIKELHRRFNISKGRDLGNDERWRFYRHFHWLRAEQLARNYLRECRLCSTAHENFVPASRAQEAVSSNWHEVKAAIECLRERADELRKDHRYRRIL